MSIRHLALFSSTRTVCMTGTSLLMMSKLHADRIETRKVFYRFMRRFMRPCDPLADRISPILMSFSMLLVKDVYDIALYMARTPCSAQMRLALTSATTGGQKDHSTHPFTQWVNCTTISQAYSPQLQPLGSIQHLSLP